MKAYLANVRILISGVDSESEACDAISESLRDLPHVLDWAYDLDPETKQYPAPVEVEVPDEYFEGDGFDDD